MGLLVEHGEASFMGLINTSVCLSQLFFTQDAFVGLMNGPPRRKHCLFGWVLLGFHGFIRLSAALAVLSRVSISP